MSLTGLRGKFTSKSVLFFLLIGTLACSKDPIASTPGAASSPTVDSIIYERVPAYQYSSKRKTIISFAIEAHGYRTFLRDTEFIYNGVKKVTLTNVAVELNPQFDIVQRLVSTSKTKLHVLASDVFEPFKNNDVENFDIGISRFGTTYPEYIDAHYFRDSSHTVPFESDSLLTWGRWITPYPGIWYTEYSSSGGYLSSDYAIQTTSPDSILVRSSGAFFSFWMNQFSPLGNWRPFPYNLETFVFDKNGKIGLLNAYNFKAQDAIPPSFIRRIHFEYDDQLDVAMSNLFSKNYLKNLPYLKLFMPGGLKGGGAEGNHSFTGINYIQDLKWMASTTRDSIFYTERGTFELKGTEETTTSLELDTKGRVAKITKNITPSGDRETFTIYYKD